MGKFRSRLTCQQRVYSYEELHNGAYRTNFISEEKVGLSAGSTSTVVRRFDQCGALPDYNLHQRVEHPARHPGVPVQHCENARCHRRNRDKLQRLAIILRVYDGIIVQLA
ncbi:hypothetical protein CANCADRAFT_30693 [Tortispora caseinolytica NRRL Y-17796]|uniref:Uncharacterized protein n=1 Tax=Tortispora caseinolytica NRRL Y-17796 TaxID=767744 RepID=A0A1E4TLC6_9ASCO|nr:hypothetical protein CANCADRAFT_30693 [Tortispora caseinolytica NRRL Y-17796]